MKTRPDYKHDCKIKFAIYCKRSGIQVPDIISKLPGLSGVNNGLVIILNVYMRNGKPENRNENIRTWLIKMVDLFDRRTGIFNW